MKNAKPVLLALVMLSTGAVADDYKIGSIRISHPWSRALPEVSRNGAAYMELSNQGTVADRLISASSPIAERAQLHTHIMDGGIMRMRPVEAVEVAPGNAAVLQPGGLHIMLMSLKQPLVKGRSFPLTLRFERAGSVEVTVTVEDHNSKHGEHTGHGD